MTHCLQSVVDLADEIMVFDQAGEFAEESEGHGASYFKCPYGPMECHSEKDAFLLASHPLTLYMLGTDLLPEQGRQFVKEVAAGNIHTRCDVFFASVEGVNQHANMQYEQARHIQRPFLFRSGTCKPAEMPTYAREHSTEVCYVKPYTDHEDGWMLQDFTDEHDLLAHYRAVRNIMVASQVDLKPNIEALEGVVK